MVLMTDDARLTEAPDQQIPTWAPTVGPGWATLLERLHHNLVVLAADYQLDDFGTQFGGLRILLSDRFDEAGEYDGAFMDAAAALIDAAEIASEHTCELCGANGRPRFRGDRHRTWIVTICETCRTGPLPGRLQDTAPVSSRDA